MKSRVKKTNSSQGADNRVDVVGDTGHHVSTSMTVGGGHTHARLKISAVRCELPDRVDPRAGFSGRSRSGKPKKMDLTRYRKIIIYALTFMAYAWSGYGAGLLTNLRDAVLAAETVFQDLFSNAITVAKKIKDIHEVFDAAVEENCVFKCPDGATPKADWNHKPRSDGCGSLGIQVNQEYLPLSEMTKCCDTHDICYDTCNTDKEKCDLEFKRCLYRYCDTYQTTGISIVNTCKAAAKVLFTGTITLGCKSFLDAQKQACFCPDKWTKNKRKKAAQAGGDL